MSLRKIGGINALLFFLFWLMILLAGADKPPPLGFLWVVVVVALCSLVVYWRIPTYIEWHLTGRPGRLRRVFLDGFAAGLVAALPFAVFGSAEPSIAIQPIGYVGWFTTVGFMGVFNSVTLYLINAVVAKRLIAANR